MKKTVLLFMAIIVGTIGMAQEDDSKSTQEYRTLFNTDKITHGGYGAVLFNYSQIDGKDAFLAGMRGMWLINHGIGIGVGGYGFVNDLKFDNPMGSTTEDYYLAGGYGGLVIEPIIGAKHPVHVSVPVLIGAGGVAYIRDYWRPQYHPDDYNYYTEDASAYFVLQPGIELEFNMVKFLRIGLGAYYRYTSDIHLSVWKNEFESTDVTPDLKGFSFGLSLKFGKF
ncbi:MAG: hypothetical protein K8R74_06555 [Bacteroidales bacterium]|nr:hypothetical protein [Bacteroidales bacterium]